MNYSRSLYKFKLNSNSLLQVTCNKSLCIHKQEIQMNKGHKSVQDSIISVIHVYYQHNMVYNHRFYDKDLLGVSLVVTMCATNFATCLINWPLLLSIK